MEALSPALVDGHGTAGRAGARRTPRADLRSGADPRPRHRPGQDQPGVPATPPGPPRPVAARRRSTSAPRRTGRWPTSGRRHGPRAGLVDAVAVQRRTGSATGRADGPPIRTEDGELIDFSTTISTAGVESRIVAGQVGETYRGDTEAAVRDIAARVRDGWRLVVIAEGHGTGQRMVEVLAEHDLPARIDDGHRDPGRGHGHGRHRRAAARLRRRRRSGSPYSPPAICPARAPPPTRRTGPCRPGASNQIDPLELVRGDAVVHEHHGVGRYEEMVQRTAAGTTREYLVIEYAPSKRGQPGDRLYVPMDQLDLLTRYVGGEHPTLDRMGGADWTKRKGRARKRGPRDRRGVDQAVRGPAGQPRSRVRAGHHLAARAGGRVRLRRDARPAGRDRRGQAGHGADRARWTG